MQQAGGMGWWSGELGRSLKGVAVETHCPFDWMHASSSTMAVKSLPQPTACVHGSVRDDRGSAFHFVFLFASGVRGLNWPYARADAKEPSKKKSEP